MLAKRSETVPPSSPFLTGICLFLVLVSIDICSGRESSNETSPTPLVAGGSDAHDDRFPYMCSVRYRGEQEHACGGILIKKRWLLTAAHCVDNFSSGSTQMAALIYCGIYRRNDRPPNKRYNADATYIHGQWESDEVGNGYDIALIKLDRAAEPPFPTLDVAGSAYRSGTRFSVLGWGLTNNNTPADELQIGLNVEVVPNDVCSSDDLWGGIIKKSMICAGTGRVDTREGDSGGPLLALDGSQENNYTDGTPCVDLLVGITSFGDADTPEDEGPNPGVYTGIGFFREWIDCIIEGRIPKENCQGVNETEIRSAVVSSIASEPPVAPLEPEESVPPPEVNRCVDFEVLGEDFEEEDALARMKEAIETDDSFAVECILEAGLDANRKHTGIEDPLPVNASLLHQAAFYEAVEAAKVLIDHGADVDIRDSREQTPLHIAAQHGSLGVAKVLVRQGAKLNVQSKRGDYPLHFAAFYGHESIVEFLAKKGADVNPKNINEETPLHIAAAKGFVSIVEILVNNEASKSETTGSGETPFDVICQHLDEDTECNGETWARLEDLLRID